MIDAQTSIEDVLPLELINVSMKGTSREEVLEEFADMFEKAGCLSDRAQFLKDAWWREGEAPPASVARSPSRIARVPAFQRPRLPSVVFQKRSSGLRLMTARAVPS